MGLAVGDVVNSTFKGTYDGQQIRYQLHWRVTVPGSSTTPEGDLQAMADFLASGVTFNVLALLIDNTSASFSFDNVACARVAPNKTIYMQATIGLVGEILTPAFPANVAIVISKRTLTQGRRGLGSLHLSGIPTSFVTSGTVNANGMTALNPVAAALLEAKTVTSVGMSIEPGLYNPTLLPGNFSRLFDTIVQGTSRVMRRRTVRVGI